VGRDDQRGAVRRVLRGLGKEFGAPARQRDLPARAEQGPGDDPAQPGTRPGDDGNAHAYLASLLSPRISVCGQCLRDHGDRPPAGLDQPHRQRPDPPVPGLHRGAHDNGVGAHLVGHPPQTQTSRAPCRRASPAAYAPARIEVTESSTPTRITLGPSVPSSKAPPSASATAELYKYEPPPVPPPRGRWEAIRVRLAT